MVRSICSFIAIFLIVTMPVKVAAFDESRKGFFISLGAGVHSVNFESDAEIDFNTNTGSEVGFASSFKIGGGLTEQFALYYVRNASWYKSRIDLYARGYTFTSGISGIGGTYFFNRSAPSPYVLAAIGVGDYAAPFSQNVDPAGGTALMIGGGFELSAHRMIEATILHVATDASADISETTATTFQLSYNHMWY